jgi:hypothetical protein
MDIYIGNLPEQFNSSQLKKIIRYALFPTSIRGIIQRWLKGKDRIEHSDLEVIDDDRGSHSVRYAHAVIEPDRLARRVVQRLDHLAIEGSSLSAREYVRRSPANDRRYRCHKNLYAVNTYNRRMGERRRANH